MKTFQVEIFPNFPTGVSGRKKSKSVKASNARSAAAKFYNVPSHQLGVVSLAQKSLITGMGLPVIEVSADDNFKNYALRSNIERACDNESARRVLGVK